MRVELASNVYWVGVVDWTVRDFHGYRTSRGSTYNSYLILDEKNVLVDTVKGPYAGLLLEHVAEHLDPARIDYIVCNHAEPDHSSSLPAVVRACPAAQVLCNEKCRVALGRHFDTAGWKFRVVRDGETLSIGRRTLTFVDTPMVHWPESMFTFLNEEGILFSMDAFGQHLATSERFDDETDVDVVMAEAKTYYANILMLYGRSIARTLDRAATIPARMLAPSHGVIWRRDLARILGAYRAWVSGVVAPKVVVLYDTMWQSTEKMALAIADGAGAGGAQVQVLHARNNSLTEIATEMLDAACVACGSATLNMTIMPELAAALTYLQGLRPMKKAGIAFGSYGWSRGGTEAVEAYLKEMHVELLGGPVEAQFVPDAAVLEKCRETGRLLAGRARSAAGKE